MRIEDLHPDRPGDHLTVIDVALRHPGDAKVATTEPSAGTAANYELWISDGETVRTYSARPPPGHPAARPPSIVGLDDPDLPADARWSTGR